MTILSVVRDSIAKYLKETPDICWGFFIVL
jgi:hypothetical protein